MTHIVYVNWEKKDIQSTTSPNVEKRLIAYGYVRYGTMYGFSITKIRKDEPESRNVESEEGSQS